MVRDDYPRLRETSPVSRDGARARAEMVCSLVGMAMGETEFNLLDVGAADGMAIAALQARYPQSTIIGLDPNESYLGAAASKRLLVVKGRGQSLPFASDSFQVVVVSATLKHFRRYQPFLRECNRVLRPGGYFVLLDPSPWGIRMGLLFGHFARGSVPNVWSIQRAARELSLYGFELAYYKNYMIIPIFYPFRNLVEPCLVKTKLDGLFLQQALLFRRVKS
jgi:ubiquinone/menaquinone biosynthesis C-methylase UbiE